MKELNKRQVIQARIFKTTQALDNLLVELYINEKLKASVGDLYKLAGRLYHDLTFKVRFQKGVSKEIEKSLRVLRKIKEREEGEIK